MVGRSYVEHVGFSDVTVGPMSVADGADRPIGFKHTAIGKSFNTITYHGYPVIQPLKVIILYMQYV